MEKHLCLGLVLLSSGQRCHLSRQYSTHAPVQDLLLCFRSLPTTALGKQQKMVQVFGSLHPCGRTGRSYRLQVLPWESPRCYCHRWGMRGVPRKTQRGSAGKAYQVSPVDNPPRKPPGAETHRESGAKHSQGPVSLM